MIVDGEQIKRVILAELKQQVRETDHGLHVVVMTLDQTPATQQHIAQLTKYADSIGMGLHVERVPSGQRKTGDVLHLVLQTTKNYDGICVELPLPLTVDGSAAQKLFPLSHDILVFGDIALAQFREKRLPFVPPVVGAFKLITKHVSLHVAGLRVAVLGKGRTVGLPLRHWLEQLGAVVNVAGSDADVAAHVRGAQVVIAGLGDPHVVKPDMLTGQPVLIDVGMQEVGNVGVGDIDPTCADVASVFAPAMEVMQPLCQLMLLRNVFAVAQLQQRQHKRRPHVKK
jgi:methylenetetrahydrofolate dehydrogenase (NADP+)/methenyltetrahydrofolate cyclohydrolase